MQAREAVRASAHLQGPCGGELCVHDSRSKGELGACSRLRTSRRDSPAAWGVEKERILGGDGVTAARLLSAWFFSKAADLTSLVEEKEQSLQESTAAILQKEEEILQLKKGEGSAPFLPSTPTLRWPRHEPAWSHWLASSLPG